MYLSTYSENPLDYFLLTFLCSVIWIYEMPTISKLLLLLCSGVLGLLEMNLMLGCFFVFLFRFNFPWFALFVCNVLFCTVFK